MTEKPIDSLRAQGIDEATLAAAKAFAEGLETAVSECLFSADEPVTQEGYGAFLARLARSRGEPK